MTIKCKVCDKEFLNEAGLGGHMSAKHGVNIAILSLFETMSADIKAMVELFKTVTSVIKTYGEELEEMHRWQTDQGDRLLQLLKMLSRVDLESMDRDISIRDTIAEILKYMKVNHAKD